MKGLILFALALGLEVRNQSLAALKTALVAEIAKATSATKKTALANKAVAAKLERVGVDANGGAITIPFTATDDVAAFLAAAIDETEYQAELKLWSDANPVVIKDTVTSNYGLDASGKLLDGFVFIKNAKGEKRAHKMSNKAEFEASTKAHTETAAYTMNACTVRDSVIKGAKGDYHQIDLSGHLYTSDCPEGRPTNLSTNTALAAKRGFNAISGVCSLDSGGVPVLRQGEEVAINIGVKRTVKESSVFDTTDADSVEAVKRAGGFVDLETKEPTVYLLDRTTSPQWSFDGVKGLTSRSTVAVNTQLQLHVATKQADLGLFERNIARLKPIMDKLIAAGFTAEEAMTMAMAKA